MNNMPYRDQLREWAQLMYTRHDICIKDIALKTGETEAGIRLWIQEGSWEGMRRTLLTSRQAQLENLYDILDTLAKNVKMQADPNTKDADLLIKYTAAIKNLEAETSAGQIIEVAILFTSWLQRIDLELTKKVTPYFDDLIKEKMK